MNPLGINKYKKYESKIISSLSNLKKKKKTISLSRFEPDLYKINNKHNHFYNWQLNKI